MDSLHSLVMNPLHALVCVMNPLLTWVTDSNISFSYTPRFDPQIIFPNSAMFTFAIFSKFHLTYQLKLK